MSPTGQDRAAGVGRGEPWWRLWAPYWEHIEDRHLGVFVTDSFADTVVEPVLVVGAGQGLVVERLKRHGVRATGVDRSRPMLEMAARRRSLEMPLADARALPFATESFETVVVSTGVVDYTADTEAIGQMLEEVMRVLRPRGTALVAFYQLPRPIEAPLRSIGVIQGGEYHMRRLFEIQATRRLIVSARRIARWTGRPLLRATVDFIKLGLAVPASLCRDAESVKQIYREAAAAGVDPERLRQAVPERIPYRGEREVRELFERVGLPCGRIERRDDCLIARCRRLSKRRQVRQFRREGPRASSAWVVRADRVSKHYSGAALKAVDSLSIVVERGTIFGLLGPNGAGKTTTLSMLCGLMAPDSGSIRFLEGLRGGALQRRIGLVPQELAIYPRLTAWENMMFFGGLYALRGEPLRRRSEELLDMVGLLDRRDHLVETFSTGMQRRLNLAGGLIHDPALVLLDEPTVGIDPQSRNCIFESISELRRCGVSLIYTTHYMEEASRLCDRIAIMDEGRIILEGDPRQAVQDYGLVRIDFTCDADDDQADELVAELWNLDFVVDCRCVGGQLSVAIENDQEAMAAAQRFVEVGRQVGVALSLAAVMEPSLESLFLEITGKSLRDGAAERVVELDG